jgi:hypothetical protein
LLEYKDSLDNYLNVSYDKGRNIYNSEECRKIDDLVCQILSIIDNAEDLKKKIEKEYKDIIRNS